MKDRITAGPAGIPMPSPMITKMPAAVTARYPAPVEREVALFVAGARMATQAVVVPVVLTPHAYLPSPPTAFVRASGQNQRNGKPTEFASHAPLPDAAALAPRGSVDLIFAFLPRGESREGGGEAWDRSASCWSSIPRGWLIGDLAMDEVATVVVQVLSNSRPSPVRRRGMKPLVSARVSDESGR